MNFIVISILSIYCSYSMRANLITWHLTCYTYFFFMPHNVISIFHCLFWLFHAYWFGYIIIDLMHLLLFILTILVLALAGLPNNNPGFASPDLTAWTEVGPSAEGQAYFEEQAVASSCLSALARFPLPARESLSFIPYTIYFCTTWCCNIPIILCHNLWWLCTCTILCWNV